MKAIIIYVSTYQGNTLKVAQAMANELSATLITTKEAENIDLSDYDLIGLGSAINFAQHHRELLEFAESHDLQNRNVFIFSTRCRPFLGKYHQALKRLLLEKGSNLVGEFSCKGFDRTGPWVAMNGYNKAHPNEKDLFKAKLFVRKIRRNIHPLAVFAKTEKRIIDKIEVCLSIKLHSILIK
jgi:flavodoxin